MADLIDRAAAKEEIMSWAVRISDPRNLSTEDTMHVLDNLPVIDAVEVVRCKDCQFCLYNEAAGTYKCRSQQGLSRFVEPMDFCSWGERVIEDA